MNIAFNINKLAMIGLGVTLDSLFQNISNAKKINIYILCADLNLHDKENINKLLSKYTFTNTIFIDIDVNENFGNFCSLQGDLTTYSRLLLQDFILEDTVLYLDADLVIELDVLALEEFDFQGKALAAVNAGQMKFALDSTFLCNEIGLSSEVDVFNAGIILFNLKYWRENDIKNKCLAFGEKYSKKLMSADQTILNGLFAGNFAFLPDEFNIPWYANIARPEGKIGILHFVGSPKPWDLFGRYFHKGFSVWESYLDFEWKKVYSKHNYSDFIRAWHIRRSYAKLSILKIKSIFS